MALVPEGGDRRRALRFVLEGVVVEPRRADRAIGGDEVVQREPEADLEHADRLAGGEPRADAGGLAVDLDGLVARAVDRVEGFPVAGGVQCAGAVPGRHGVPVGVGGCGAQQVAMRSRSAPQRIANSLVLSRIGTRARATQLIRSRPAQSVLYASSMT